MMKAYGSLHCLQEQEAEYSAESSSDGEQSAPLNGNHTQLAYLPPDKMTAFSRLSRYGMTFKPLMENRGEELLTWYLAGFPAKTFPAQEKAQGLKESEADCGQSLPGLLAKYDPATHSLRTAQCSLFGDLTECYVTLPRWGLMRDGALYLPPTVALPMREKESGLLPTPSGVNAGKNHVMGRLDEMGGSSNMWRGSEIGKVRCASFEEWMMGWPTGWSAQTPLETDKFQSAWLKHFDYLANSDETKPNYARPQD